MTIFGWDASHWDWGRGPMDIAAAVRDGISFMTHKATDKTARNDRYDDFARRARGVVPLLGAYTVNHPGDQRPQVDEFIRFLDQVSPWWREGPFIVQVDAEKFDYMPREPNLAEIKSWCDYFMQRTGGRWRPVVYAPRWLYSDRLRGLPYRLWASSYGDNPAVHYRQAYPGDGSGRWAAYSGQTPAILQYGSTTRIGSQSTCDANAFRGTLDQLRALVFPSGGGEDDMEQTERLIHDTGAANRTVGHVFADIENLRNWMVSPPGTSSLGVPPAGSVGAIILESALQGPVTPAPVDIDALVAALRPHLEAAAEAAVRKVLGGLDGATPPR